jgi:hypothetical protein
VAHEYRGDPRRGTGGVQPRCRGMARLLQPDREGPAFFHLFRASASTAPKAPWTVRAATTIRGSGQTPYGRDGGETDQAVRNERFPAEQIAEARAERKHAPKRQRVSGDDPFAVPVRKCSARWAYGSAILTTVVSSTTITCTTPTTTRISERRE